MQNLPASRLHLRHLWLYQPIQHFCSWQGGSLATGRRLRDCQQQAKSVLQPHRASPAGRRGVGTSNRDFCTSHWPGLAAEIHVGVNIKLLGRYSVTSQGLSSAPTRRPAVAAGPHISSSGRRDCHAHPGLMPKQICDLASQPGRAQAVAPACSPRDNELSLGSCFFQKHSGFAVLAVPGPG